MKIRDTIWSFERILSFLAAEESPSHIYESTKPQEMYKTNSYTHSYFFLLGMCKNGSFGPRKHQDKKFGKRRRTEVK
jgi:hypothetical protein